MKHPLLSLVATVALAGGCTSLNTVSLTPIPKDRSRPVSHQVHDWSFLGIKLSNRFIDGVPDELRRQCPDGTVSGILTKHENVLYVLVLKRVVKVSGYCVRPVAVVPPPAEPAPAPPPPPRAPGEGPT